jgi:hypothetical protein
MGGGYTSLQHEWRCCKNDAVTPTTFYALEDGTDGVLDTNTDILRVRVDLQETGGTDETLTDLKLQYSTNDTDFTDLGAGNHWNWADGLGTDGASLTSFILSGSADPGMFLETGTQDPVHVKRDDQEFDFAITPTANVSNSTKYYFRVVYATSTVMAVDGAHVHPQITTTAPVTPENLTNVKFVEFN